MKSTRQNLFEIELQNNIDFDIKRKGYSYLFESMGYPNVVFNFTKGFIDVCSAQIKQTRFESTSETYTQKDFKSNIPFIENFQIAIDMRIDDGDSGSKGGFSDLDSKMYMKNGEILLYPVIEIYVHGKSIDDLKNELFSAICHEMTHGYSEYMTLKSDKAVENYISFESTNALYGISVSTLMFLSNNKTQIKYYRNNSFLNDRPDSWESIFSRISYFVSEPEKRAQISELRHELESKSQTIRDSKSASNAIINSNVYKIYKWLNDNIDYFINTIIDKKFDNLHKGIIRSFNNVFDKKYESIEKIIKYFDNIRNSYNRFFINRSGKVVQDIMDQNMAMSGHVDKNINFSMKDIFNKAEELESTGGHKF